LYLHWLLLKPSACVNDGREVNTAASEERKKSLSCESLGVTYLEGVWAVKLPVD